MSEKYWRISYNSIGIYEALKNNLWHKDKISIWNELKKNDSFRWLQVPTTYSNKSRSYFTEKGYKTFIKKNLPIMEEYLEKDSIVIERFELDYSTLKILYEDEYQIVIEK